MARPLPGQEDLPLGWQLHDSTTTMIDIINTCFNVVKTSFLSTTGARGGMPWCPARDLARNPQISTRQSRLFEEFFLKFATSRYQLYSPPQGQNNSYHDHMTRACFFVFHRTLHGLAGATNEKQVTSGMEAAGDPPNQHGNRSGPGFKPEMCWFK